MCASSLRALIVPYGWMPPTEAEMGYVCTGLFFILNVLLLLLSFLYYYEFYNSFRAICMYVCMYVCMRLQGDILISTENHHIPNGMVTIIN